MKRVLIIFFGIIFTLFGYAQNGNITIEIKEVKSPKDGPIVIMLFQSAEGFPAEINKAAYYHIVRDIRKITSYKFVDIPYGIYAVAIFQDENNNKEVDRNWIGMPDEPVGVSNQTRMGRPKFSRSQFEHNSPQKIIQLEFIND